MSRSVSQLKTYKLCPYRYKLERIDKVWQRPAAWLAQGTAVHAAAEAQERSARTLTLEEAKYVFRSVYTEEINTALEETPNLDYWFSSGPYRGPEDIERRFKVGQEQVEKYLAWGDRHPEEVIWIAEDGTPGIELGFDIDLDGVQIRGFIDQVLALGSPRVDKGYVRDIKTGSMPGDEFQLATYAVALDIQYGLEVSRGDYWMGRTGKATYAYDLTQWPRNRVADEFCEVDEMITGGQFEPDPEPSKCRFCAVASSCEFSL